MSLCRQNFSKEAEDAINRQILTELTASYTYLSMSNWLARDTVALHGLAELYRKNSQDVGMPKELIFYHPLTRNMNTDKNLLNT